MNLSRRAFTHTVAATFAAQPFISMANTSSLIKLGICASPDRAEKLKTAGFDFIECGVSGQLKPDVDDAKFAPDLAKLVTSALPIQSCNGFIPAKFKLTGPTVDHEAALAYAEIACQRADKANIPFIVLGSGKARQTPEGFAPAEGKKQFIAFCQALGKRIANCRVTIVLEPLNKGETNLLNSVAEGIDYVDAINHPRIQLLADFYHMMKENESADSIRKAGNRIRHCHIAELQGRKSPGTANEDLSAFFKALRDIHYTGGVSCECSWPKENVEEAWKKALDIMKKQMS